MGQAVRAEMFRASARPLKAGDLIKTYDGSVHFIQYVNHSGAYAVPLAGINRDIKGHTVTFTAGGRMISANSMVEHILPLSLGGNSHEYRAYAKMALALETKGGTVAQQGVGFGEFDSSELKVDPDLINAEEISAAEGHTVRAESVFAPSNRKGTKVAKAKANGAVKAKREKAPKKVRLCADGCGGETSGYFVPGHDARLHSWILKLGKGTIDGKGVDVKSKEKVVPASVLKALELVATKDGFKAKNPKFYQEQ